MGDKEVAVCADFKPDAGGLVAVIVGEVYKLVAGAARLATISSFVLAWAMSICLLGWIGRSKWICYTVLTSCRNEWSACCGGNQNNRLIIGLHDSRPTTDLKEKLAWLMDPDHVNNIWCSRWSSVTAKYIYWTIQKRGEWSIKELIKFEQLFMIEILGTALVALVGKCEARGN